MIACISIPYFAAAVERRADKALAHKPLAIGGRPWEAKPVYAFSQEVARMGVKSGMSLRLVQVLSPQSHFMPAMEAKYNQVAGEVVDVLTDFSCLIEPQELWHSPADPKQPFTRNGRALPARYCLDLEGLPMRESTDFVKEMGRTLRQESELAPAIGLATNKFTAEIAATVCRSSHALPVPPGDDARFLASRPIDFLPLDKESSRRLHLLGIRTLGQLADLPESAVRTQFGPEMEPFYHLAQGQPGEPVQARPVERRETVARSFDDPVADFQVIAAVLSRLSAELAQRLQAENWEGRELHIRLEMDDGTYQEHELILRRPTADSRHLAIALKEMIAQAALACGVAALAVTLADLKPAVVKQLGLFTETAGRGQIHLTLRNLAAKYKTSRFYGPVLTERDHPLPERRFQLQALPLVSDHDPALA